jgi:hypothetical protein
MKSKIFSLALVLVLFSCSKSDEASDVAPPTVASVSGSYLLTKINVSVPQDLNNDGIKSTNIMSETNCYNQNILVLKENGTYTLTDKGLEIEISGPNGSITTLSCYTDPIISGTWSLSGNTIKFIDNGETRTLNVKDNTITETVLSGQTVAVFNNGYAYATADIQSVLVKQ